MEMYVLMLKGSLLTEILIFTLYYEVTNNPVVLKHCCIELGNV